MPGAGDDPGRGGDGADYLARRMDADVGTAGRGDFEAVRRLLEEARLPTRDLTPEMLEHFLVARRGAELVGVIGLEPLGDVGLLRSAAVAPELRGTGLGGRLTDALERYAREAGVGRLYLLTTTAAAYFDRHGYVRVPRDEAPAAIRDTTEFRELCAATSVCMVKELSTGRSA